MKKSTKKKVIIGVVIGTVISGAIIVDKVINKDDGKFVPVESEWSEPTEIRTK